MKIKYNARNVGAAALGWAKSCLEKNIVFVQKKKKRGL